MADHKNKKQNETVDAGLCGNEKIEEAIAALQQEPTQEMLALGKRKNEIYVKKE